MANAAVTAPLFIGKQQDRSRSLLKDRAIRGAIALILSAVASGALSYIFWAFIAHHQSAAGVGKVSAEVSSIGFLATVGSLNLTSIFGRYLPVAGRRTRALIALGYGGACLVGLLSALIFLATPLAKGLVIGGAAGSLTFVICVVLNSIFNIQDGGLIGFGRFEWIPIENVVVSLTRFALLPVAAIFLSAQASVLGAWLLPMAVAVVVVNIYNLGPLAGGKKRQRPALPNAGELSHMIIVGAISSSVNAAVSSFLPTLVTHRLGSVQGGYFYVPWMISTMVALLLMHITTSMIREIVANPTKAGTAIRRSIGMAVIVVIGIVLSCVLLANLILAPLGSSFASHGAPLMRWGGLAMPATTVIIFFWALCSIQRRPWPAFAVNLFTAIAIFGGVLLMRSGSDITRVGMIYCAVQWLAALVLLLPTYTGLRAIARKKEPRGSNTGSSRRREVRTSL
jgi:O-antigen/teichoic acid export membrane protein